MKTTEKISKAAVMTRAWNIFRGKYHYSDKFSECLRRAWQVERDNVASRAKQAAEKQWADDYKGIEPALNQYFSIAAMIQRDNIYNRNGYQGD
jgi:hypothetical protein